MSFSMSFLNPPCDDKGRGCGNPPPIHQTLILVEKYGLKRGLMEPLLELSVVYDCSIRFVFLYYPKFLLRSSLLYLHYFIPFYRSVILIPQSLLSSSTSFSISFVDSFSDVSHICLKYSINPSIISYSSINLPPPTNSSPFQQ